MSKTVIKLIGRKTDFRGESLWDVLSNLRNFGVGRLVIRNMFQRYPEPCYYKILNVEAFPAPTNPHEPRKSIVTVEKTWRGVTSPKPVTIFSTSYKCDYELVPKEEEGKYLSNSKKIEEKILPNKIDMPPLLREFVTQETGEKNPMLKLHFKKTHNKFVRVAEEGEKPNVQISMGIGKPKSSLYEGVL
ncbi:uncharacterized protein LOC119668162 [Teleopsis dalmanni]|uniref:uncharacterized protein LOC119668162 n=1 Tax=Teleopsis dalmanni TaxID=139649 RepID=UPI0018CCEDE6|nr:uncharacterized protein LOC119668162 [Teleopsis dalmanni]